uniref:RBR-type E3 ubiquitin transferase n=1 Tax=Noccaea caerulescens TaxID=107243 RepID=A0A1J3EH55_NOCCA
MEDDLEKPYSVLTRDEAKENMKKQIDEISEIFLISKSDATVLLMNLGWDSVRVSERLSEDKEKLLAESGLTPVVVDSNRDLSDSSCDMFYEFDDDVDGEGDDELISTAFCFHKFSTTHWREYLDKNFYSLGENKTVTISCPNQDCRVAVGPETIEKLTVRDQDAYESYILRSYLERTKNEIIKQCPAPGCDYLIEFLRWKDPEECSLNVVCLCGHTFCWRCGIESHIPVTCNNASDWLSTELKKLKAAADDSSSRSWIDNNTKPCPFCLAPADFGGYRVSRFVTCDCGGEFCWRCLKSKESHLNGPGLVFGPCVGPEVPVTGSREEVDTTCLDRWEAAQVSMEEAKSKLRAFEDLYMKKPACIFTEEYIKNMREGLMLVVQSTQVVKWSCVYDHLLTEYEMSKKVYLRALQDNATSLVHGFSETLKVETENVFYASASDESRSLKESLSTICLATRNIGNYFYHFVKSLQEGLVDVKVKSYDDFGGRYWFCDRCTYGNTWFQKKCKMCVDPSASPEKDQMVDCFDATASPEKDDMDGVVAPTASTEKEDMDGVVDPSASPEKIWITQFP